MFRKRGDILQSEFYAKKCTVLGLGISNLPLIDFLLDCGAVISARDRKEIDLNDEKIKGFISRGVTFVTGEDYLKNIDADYIFRSPGIRPDIAEISEAVNNGAILTSEMELFFELCPAKIFAITGSDGKTTTTTLTYKMLSAEAEKKANGRKVYVGGNIGAPLLPHVYEMSADDYAVVELSSFQLMTMQKSALAAAITNVTPNHLNWHTDMEEYTASKFKVFGGGAKRIVLNADNEATASRIGKTGGEEIAFSLNGKCDFAKTNIYLEDGFIKVNGEEYLNTADIKIPGKFNIANYMCAIGMTMGFVSKETINEVAKSFGGVEHRNEFVRELDGVKYYNSSIDSSPSRTIASFTSYPQKPVLICCGRDKHVPFDEMAVQILKHAKALVLSGESRDKIYTAMQNAGCKDFNIIMEPDFEKAIYAAKSIAEPGDIVLLSPSCTSFDAFKNFEERGKKFKETVNNF